MSQTEVQLLFPQWQGAGSDAPFHETAHRLAERAWPHRKWKEVKVPPPHPLPSLGELHGREALASQLREARALLQSSQASRVFLAGGDCGAEVAPIAHLNAQLGGNLAVVWLDAHGDLHTPATSPSGLFHGMALRTLLGEGDPELVREVPLPLQPRQLFLAGVRALDPPEQYVVRAKGLTVLSPNALAASPSLLLERIRSSGFRNVYLHVDADVLDPAELPQLFCPSPWGLSVASLVNLLEGTCRALHCVGASLVEVCPGQKEPLPAQLEPLLRWFSQLSQGEARVQLEPFHPRWGAQVRRLILSIQRDEFGLPISAEQQPDLFDIPQVYQQSAGEFWIARCEAHVVGTLALHDLGGGFCALRKMFVAPDFRGPPHRVAQRLLDQLLVHARASGLKEVALGTTARFLAAHRFYEKNGFEEIPREALPPGWPHNQVDVKFYRLRL
jgi:arginase